MHYLAGTGFQNGPRAGRIWNFLFGPHARACDGASAKNCTRAYGPYARVVRIDLNIESIFTHDQVATADIRATIDTCCQLMQLRELHFADAANQQC